MREHTKACPILPKWPRYTSFTVQLMTTCTLSSLLVLISNNLYICSSPGHVKDDVINNASGGYENLASVSSVEGAGHLVSSIHLAIERHTDIDPSSPRRTLKPSPLTWLRSWKEYPPGCISKPSYDIALPPCYDSSCLAYDATHDR